MGVDTSQHHLQNISADSLVRLQHIEFGHPDRQSELRQLVQKALDLPHITVGFGFPVGRQRHYLNIVNEKRHARLRTLDEKIETGDRPVVRLECKHVSDLNPAIGERQGVRPSSKPGFSTRFCASAGMQKNRAVASTESNLVFVTVPPGPERRSRLYQQLCWLRIAAVTSSVEGSGRFRNG